MGASVYHNINKVLKTLGTTREESVRWRKYLKPGDIAQSSTFEEVSFLLLYDRLPTQEELRGFQSDLVSEREVPEAVYGFMKMMPKTTHPMDILQASVSILAGYDPQLRDESRDANFKKALRLIAKLPHIVATWDRIRKGKEPIRPHLDLTHAGNFLYMLSGSLPDPDTARDFDICLILHAEHSFNASTFAGREVASTHAHFYASIAAAMGALSGELHGGANSEVMKMLLEIGEAWGMRYTIPKTRGPLSFVRSVKNWQSVQEVANGMK